MQGQALHQGLSNSTQTVLICQKISCLQTAFKYSDGSIQTAETSLLYIHPLFVISTVSTWH